MENCADICSPNISILTEIYNIFPNIDTWKLIPCYYSEDSEKAPSVEQIQRVPTLLESVNFVV